MLPNSHSVWRRLMTLFLAACFVLPSPVWAWGAEGHELVGAVADRLLRGSAAADKVKNLLQGRSLAQVAGWADCLKSVNPELNFEYTNAGKYVDCKIFENTEDIVAMVSFVKRNHDACFAFSSSRESCHKHYHYTDLNLQQSGYAYPGFGSASEDIVQALNASIAYLQGRSVPEPFHFANDSEALLMLVHLVGDIHQPLHVAGVYLDDDGNVLLDHHLTQGPNPQKAGTAGGNALQIDQSNLHSMWDKISPTVKDAVWRQFEQTPGQVPNSFDRSALSELPAAWADESLHAARQAFTDVRFGRKTATPRGDRWNADLPADYRAKVEVIQVERIEKAGRRLAAILKTIYG